MSSRALKKLYGKSDLDLLSSKLNEEEDDAGEEECDKEVMAMQGEEYKEVLATQGKEGEEEECNKEVMAVLGEQYKAVINRFIFVHIKCDNWQF